ncbi:hypothetical protein PsYK624_053400 [Phanerochaete sordida]|uniref:F-box domain-containing protein n=1 Tax=Phanerochaete sordida TaxID=48140 RepID=A0A9P3LC63_9APHY|nr:hypothetical protein PsYK624_053400 [Phanerochaete sordida]
MVVSDLAMPPISTLPPEMVAEIQYWIILDVCHAAERKLYPSKDDYTCPHVAYRFTPPPSPYSWLIIRRICKAWRHIALTFPELSTHIFITRPGCVKDLLDRSGTLPLHIYQANSMYERARRDDVAASCRLVLPQFFRIVSGSLMLMDTMNVPESLLPKNGASTAISLEIEIQKAGGDRAHTWISNLTFPNLTQLTVTNAAMRTVRPMLVASLRILRLMQCEPIPAKELRSILEPMKHLEELVLCDMIAGEEDMETIRDTYLPGLQNTIDLPHLRALTITQSCASAGIPFLRSIAHPASTSLRLNFRSLANWHMEQRDRACYVQLLTQAVAAWNTLPGPPRALRVATGRGHMNAYSIVNLWCTARDKAALCDAPRDSTFFQISFQSDQEAFLGGLLAALPLGGVTHALLVDSAALWDVIRWEKLMERLEAAEELTVYYEAVEEEPRRGPPPAFSANGLCPRLNTLCVRETRQVDRYFALKKAPKDRITLAHVARALTARLSKQEQSGETGGKAIELDAQVVDALGNTQGPVDIAEYPQVQAKRWLSGGVSRVSAILKRTSR